VTLQKQKQTSKDMSKTETNHHVPVLLDEVLNILDPKPGDSYLDLTAGYGGHASKILSIADPAHSVLVDRDEQAVRFLRRTFETTGASIKHMDFLQASQELVQKNARFDVILADLGVSSPHLDNASRGFSIVSSGPLDMRMDTSQAVTAYDIVNSASEEELRTILKEYGEEPRFVQMARTIIASRPISTTTELAQIAKKVWPGHSRVHPATRLFQAVRIAVNRELELLEQALPLWLTLLKPGGRLGVISFHSLEDRLVKQYFRERVGDGYDAEVIDLTRRPVTASPHELVINPRSRSAKLRVVAKIKTNNEG
jgi:16S rRNA (cytosine1402-N4)-methyltransferase